jgi:hypothetical protein
MPLLHVKIGKKNMFIPVRWDIKSSYGKFYSTWLRIHLAQDEMSRLNKNWMRGPKIFLSDNCVLTQPATQ